ncbi:Choline dehydrogenase, mitochondrial [Hondaea fermentalgiana]|uniref:Choline dehydrogenase, mitochondrial n=1 Tax=Hondaea fermentalgiana TaxID=2315210 RepID=A0A2R5GRI0_9STRA|nr:Choline dehydrogenase, mitochondrial [Hondaea fermentalgiana]|eukprot:GBG33487.1 Choline dehydrogenase, mitochondrial [Hondaea fermentalgiana]
MASAKADLTFDYVVIGAGSAGCVAASRLSENPEVSVLLLEAGGSNQTYAVQQPLVTLAGLQNSKFDWAFRSEPQGQQNGRVAHWPRGKCLGGSSSINYMLYVRGDKRNYDQWAREFGCEGWSYEEVLPFFKKSESLTRSKMMDSSYHDAKTHGFEGPLKVTDLGDPKYKFPAKHTSECFVAACEEHGIQGPRDFNGAEQDGAGMAQVTVCDGKRVDTASAFLFATGAMKRSNLTVLTHAHVEQIVIENGTAIGVRFKSGKHSAATLKSDAVPSRFAGARHEVVLSAGAVGTPQLLMLSGVGPREELQKHGIACVSDLPVGENLSDHLLIPIEYAIEKHIPSFSGSGSEVLRGFYDYYSKRNGTFAAPLVTAMAFFRSGVRPEEDGNDVQIHFCPYAFNDKKVLRDNLGYDTSQPRYKDLGPPARVMFIPTAIRPRSKGSVKLRSASAFDSPVIDPKYLDHDDDLRMLTACYRKCIELAEKSTAFKNHLGARTVNEDSAYAPNSDEYIEEEIRNCSLTIYHPVGTAKMGRVDDPNTVVDAKTLKVKGVRNLRVADASVFPEVPSGNTNAPAIMVGERVADMISKSTTASQEFQA